MNSRLTFLLCISLSIFSTVGWTDDDQKLRPADTSSPRATLETFIDSMNAIHELVAVQKYANRNDPAFRPLVKRMVDCLDLSEQPAFAREEFAGQAAACIKEILDRTEFAISDAPALDSEDQTDKKKAETRYRIRYTRLVIALVTEGEQRGEYLFTPGSLERAISDYEDVKEIDYRTSDPAVSKGIYEWYVTTAGNAFVGGIVESLPAFMHNEWAGLVLWKWFGFALLLILSILFLWGLYWLHG